MRISSLCIAQLVTDTDFERNYVAPNNLLFIVLRNSRFKMSLFV